MLNPFYIDSHHPDHHLYTSKSLKTCSLYCQSYSACFNLPAAEGEMEEKKKGLQKLSTVFYQRENVLYCIECMMYLL